MIEEKKSSRHNETEAQSQEGGEGAVTRALILNHLHNPPTLVPKVPADDYAVTGVDGSCERA